MPVKVKICGICTIDDARAALAAGADLLGLNFHPPSPRHQTLAEAERLVAAVPAGRFVGVFVDAPRALVEERAVALGLVALQFHGDEDPEYCCGWRWPTVKALRVHPGADVVATAARYPTDYVLLDGYQPGIVGGTGTPFDLAQARGIPPARLIVAGGLRPETVADVVRALRPFAVDVASGVEERPGRKDHAKIEEFIRRAKAT